jgi:hypothetical protein
MTREPNDEFQRDRKSELDHLLEQFEKLSPVEQNRQIAKANAYLRANGIDSLSRLDEWAHR